MTTRPYRRPPASTPGFQPPGPIAIDGPGLLVPAAMLPIVAALARYGIDAYRRLDGIEPPAVVQAVCRSLVEAAEQYRPKMSASGRSLAGTGVWPEGFGVAADELLTTAQAAAVLGVTDRHVRRIAPDLGGELKGRAWFFDPAVVTEYSADRARRLE